MQSGPAAVPSPGLSSFLSPSLTCLRNLGTVLILGAVAMEATRDQAPGTRQVGERAAQGRMLLLGARPCLSASLPDLSDLGWLPLP